MKRDAVSQEHGRWVVILNQADSPSIRCGQCEGRVSQTVLFRHRQDGFDSADRILDGKAAPAHGGNQGRREHGCDAGLDPGTKAVGQDDLYIVMIP